jgi:outer membrane protein
MRWFFFALAVGLAAPVVAQEPLPPLPPPPDAEIDLRAVLRGDGRALTSDQAVRLALETSPDLGRSEASIRQAGAAADRALYVFIPQVALSMRYTRLSPLENPSFLGAPEDGAGAIDELLDQLDPINAALWSQLLQGSSFPIVLDQFAGRAAFTVPLSDLWLTALPSWEAARSATQAAEAQRDDVRAQVVLRAREAYYDFARARGAYAIALAALRSANAREAQVQAFLEAGTAAPVDGLRVRAQRASAEVSLRRAEGAVALAEGALRTVLHLEDDGVTLGVAEDIFAPLPPLEGEVATLVQQALAQRSDVRSLRELLTSTERQIAAAEGSRMPRLAVAFNVDVANPNPRIFPQTARFEPTWDLSAILSWNLHDMLNGRSQAAEARALLDQRREDLRTLEDGIRVQVIEAFTSYRAATEALEAAQLGVEAADESYRIQLERYGLGALTATDLIQTSLEQVQARLDWLTAAIDGRVARARLERALGGRREAE